MRDLPDFDTLKSLAEDQPDQLQLLLEEQVEALVNRASLPLQRRLRGLQFQVDAQRNIQRTPMAACLKISSMMHDMLAQLPDLLLDLAQLHPTSASSGILSPVGTTPSTPRTSTPNETKATTPTQSAAVLPLICKLP